MSREFYNLCYDQYKLELADADSIYQRAGVMLIALPALGAGVIAMGRIDILAKCFTRIDVGLYYLVTAAAFVALALSTVFLVRCVYPRRYKSLANMDTWLDWCGKYQEYLKKDPPSGETPIPNATDAAVIDNMCPRIAEAQAMNATINERRRKHFQKSVFWSALCLAATGLQAVLALLLKVQGIRQ